MNVQVISKIIFMLICTIACIVILGLLLASLYFLLQVAVIILPMCLIAAAIFFLAQLIYFKHRISALKAGGITGLFMPGFSQQAGHWNWKPEDRQVNLHADAGVARFLGIAACIIFAWIALSVLYKSGVFSRQAWWFLGHSARVNEKASLAIACILFGLAIFFMLVKSNPVSIFKRFLAGNIDSFVSMEDRGSLEQANSLLKRAMQAYSEARQEVQRAASLSSAMELEQISQALGSANLYSLIQNRKWHEFKSVAEGIIADLQRLKNAGAWRTDSRQNESEEERAYRILGVSMNAGEDEIREAYRKLALLWHPDRAGGNGEIMKNINWAYDILKSKRQFA